MTDALVRLYVRIWRALVYRKWRARYLARADRRRARLQARQASATWTAYPVYVGSGNPYMNAAQNTRQSALGMYNQQNALSSAQLANLLGMNNAR